MMVNRLLVLVMHFLKTWKAQTFPTPFFTSKTETKVDEKVTVTEPVKETGR